jgi:hypothetical protein
VSRVQAPLLTPFFHSLFSLKNPKQNKINSSKYLISGNEECFSNLEMARNFPKFQALMTNDDSVMTRFFAHKNGTKKSPPPQNPYQQWVS